MACHPETHQVVNFMDVTHIDLPMLIRSEGVGLRLKNRRERGKTKKQRTKMHFVSDYVV
jgi:hypothetical protein